jgi:hypothetical protein
VTARDGAAVGRHDDVVRLNLWSGPRNLSTALMYSFGQRADTRVVDEPFYGHFLARTDGAGHPGGLEMIAMLETDADKVIAETILGPCDRPVLFLKNMPHHLPGVDLSFLAECANAILIRHPREVIISFSKEVPNPGMDLLGFQQLVDLYDRLWALGQDPPVIDSKELLLNPEFVLTELCQRIGIAFDPAMLSWPPGPRPEDGPWAKFWYAGVHASTGFKPYKPPAGDVPPRLRPLLDRCLPLYDRLAERAIQPD